MPTIVLHIVAVAWISSAGLGWAQDGGSPVSVRGVLDGKVFVGHVGPRGGEANGEDELVFQNGRLLSTSCSKYGFESGPYEASRQGETVVFEALTRSPRHGQIFWKGKVSGDRAQAEYLWTKKRWYWFDAREEHWFEGRLQTE
jgi:hypothetical protein